MRKLIFFLGPAGAGKTTIAKALAQRRQLPLFDMDTLSRPAAEVIMTLAGLDPNDRDSTVYKRHCRDLGYRITMDAALENLELGLDVIVIGPFTKEIEDPLWLENELLRIGASLRDVETKVLYLFLPDESFYRLRIAERGLDIDAWKLENWSNFNQTLIRREIKWNIPAASILYFDNSEPLTQDKLLLIEKFIYA
jgi:GTPase SAR1 family protein